VAVAVAVVLVPVAVVLVPVAVAVVLAPVARVLVPVARVLVPVARVLAEQVPAGRVTDPVSARRRVSEAPKGPRRRPTPKPKLKRKP
jgi:hypothetical protein